MLACVADALFYGRCACAYVLLGEHVLHSKYFKERLGLMWEKFVTKAADKDHFKILSGVRANSEVEATLLRNL